MALDAAPPLGLVELTRWYGEMAWIEARLGDVVAWWSTFEAHDLSAIAYASIGRHHQWHAELWRSALPDSPELDAGSHIKPPHDGWISLFEELVRFSDPTDTAARLSALSMVLDPWLKIRNEQLLAAANDVSDRAARRIQRFVTIDHEDDHDGLIGLLQVVPGAATSDIPGKLFPCIGDNH